jgi:hypothetical protein
MRSANAKVERVVLNALPNQSQIMDGAQSVKL